MKKLGEGRKRMRQEAGLDDFQLPEISDDQNPARALVIACSESTVLSAFVASLDPLGILQNLGGTVSDTRSRDPNYNEDDAGWGTVAYALGEMGLKQVVFCGHSECSVAAGWQAGNRGLLVPESRVKNATEPTDRLYVAAELPAYKRASQTLVVEQMLRAEAYLADRSCSQDVDITVHALWFDEDQRQIFAYAQDQRRFVLMNRRDIQRLIALLSADQGAV